MDEIRVKIRKHGSLGAKLLRFEKSSVQLNPLIMKIAYKLLAGEDMSGFDASQHQLLLEGKYLVETVSEIANDDELVLRRADEAIAESSTASPQRVGSMVAATTSVTPVKKEEEEPTDQVRTKREPGGSTVEIISMLDDDDESAVKPDVNISQKNPSAGSERPRVTGVKREAPPTIRRQKKKKPEIITIDDDSETDDDSSSDGSIEDGSDAWMSSDEDDDDDEEDESDFEPDSDDDDDEEEVQKITAKSIPPN